MCGEKELLVRGEFLARVNRFALSVRVSGHKELAHLPNPGRLRDVLTPGRPLLLRPASPGRKTAWTAVAAEMGDFLVSLDSTLPNRAFPGFLRQGLIPELLGFRVLAREPRLGSGRADFLLVRGEEKMWVEVKSVTMVEEGVALFPDAPTARGARHLRELAGRVSLGERALVLFVVQRPDARKFGPNTALDPDFTQAFCEALSSGVMARAVVCSFDGRELHPLRVLSSESLVIPKPCGLRAADLP